MNLIAAIDIAGMLQITESDIELYQEKILSYLRGLKELYLECSITPNHHLAVHLVIFLRLFGPVHSWRAFAFERFNYLLQRLPINNKIGESRSKYLDLTLIVRNPRRDGRYLYDADFPSRKSAPSAAR